MTNQDNVIEVKNVSMIFNLATERLDSLKEYFLKLKLKNNLSLLNEKSYLIQ